MTNTQLWAITPTGAKIKLDTYETDPIKLTFTAENLSDLPTVNSTYSQTFRLPATGTNNQFFDYWFNVNANDFDVSKKTSAEIITEAGFFIDGQIRLQKVYRNYESTLIDYEVLFLGEVRDFSTQVGEGFMNSINCNDLAHILNHNNIITSWNALAGTTNGLKNGNVLYPLVEYGYSYNSAGQVQQNQLHTSGSRRFTQANNALDLWQWRPWIRAKYLIDQIFNSTSYTYSSVFLESDLFQNLYVNATGNTATPDTRDLLSTNLMQVVAPDQTFGTVNGVQQIWNWPAETFDYGNNWNVNVYTAPLTGAYTFQYNFDGNVTWVNIGGGSGSFPDVTIQVFYTKNGGAPQIIGTADNGGLDPTVYFTNQGNLNLNLVAGDQIRFGYRIQHLNPPPTLLFETTLYGNALSVISAPVSVNPGTLLSSRVKTIDWFRSIISRFRLVMVPDRENPRNFIIEPWNDYIATGKKVDWTHKIDGSKDIQFEPLFFTQASNIRFTDAEDSDHPNVNHLQVFKEVYGTRIFDSNNELLKGERVISTVMAPTPVERVEGTVANNIIIPHMGTLEPVEGTNGGRLVPIAAKPRLVFWNGMKANGFPGNQHWYMYNDFTQPQQMHTYPMVSYMSEFPTTATTQHLSWELEYPRFTEPPIASLGKDVYTTYWEDFIESTYSNEARKMTATFILDAQDLKITFRDSIFIRDSWWRILKITDAPLSGLNAVKVELIKLLDAPEADCDCEKYYVTDGRTIPESVAFFTYIDCTTGEPTTGEVFQNSVVVCSCKPFSTGDPQVFVTDTGESCTTRPPIPVPVDVDIFKNINPGGAVVIQNSTTGVGDWTTAYSVDLPIGEYANKFPYIVNSGEFTRIGYSSLPPGQLCTITWYRNDEVVNRTTFVPRDAIQYSTFAERIDSLANYRASISITEA